MNELEFHPYANLFPLIEGEAFDALVEDIQQNGLREPIVLFEGRILDGRNRYRAALQAGVIDWRGKATSLSHHRPTVRQFMISGLEGDALAWVISANLHRRHLDDGQRAMVAAKLATMGHGGNRLPKAKPPIGDLPAAAAEPPAMTQALAAQALNVSERNVQRAKVVAEEGVPELVAAAEKGAIAVSLAADLARLPKEEQAKLVKELDVGVIYGAAREIIARQKKQQVEQKKASRAAREQALGTKQRALPNKKFGVIYADPEWDFETRSEAGKNRAAANHYPVSPIEVIKSRPVQDIAADDCVLFLWVTVPHEELGHQVMKAWGFDYKSQWVWFKTGGSPGTGYWSRVDHEILLIGTRGNPPAPAPGTQASSVIEAPAGAHSEKPERAAELIEKYFPTLPKIELNARRARPGWDVWGNEAPEAEGGRPGFAAELGALIERHKAAADAEPPFIVEHDGVAAIVVTAGYGPEIYAVHLNRPFPSETGYRSMLGCERQPGEDREAYGRRLIERALAPADGKKVKPEPLRLPERAYRLPAGADGKPIARERGVWVDRGAPLLGLDAGLIDGLEVIRERWTAEDRALYSGQKGKRTCPKSLHPNHKIIAVSGQMLTPLAEFPSAGAYVVTGSQWVAGKRVDGWCYVDEAAFHDNAPGEMFDDVEIPAFLRRSPAPAEPERCDQTADLLDRGA